MTINDYLDSAALDELLEKWAAATNMIAVVLDDEGNFLSNKLGFSRNNIEAFGEDIEVDEVIVASVIGMFVYNCWGLYENFHGIFPYTCNIPAIQDALDSNDHPEENYYESMYVNADLYTYLIQLKNSDFSYAIVSTADCYGGLIPGIRRAADYAGTGLNRDPVSESAAPFYIEFLLYNIK